MKDVSVGAVKIRGAIGALFLFVGVNSICTQFVAYRMTYHSALGTPISGHIYNPFEWWKWAFKFYDYSPVVYSQAFGICAIGIIAVMAGLRIFIGVKTRSSRKHEGSHGTARFATIDDIRKSGLIPPEPTILQSLLGKIPQGDGVYCGGFYDEKTGRTMYLRHPGREHVAVIAPTGSGKGVGLVIPTLLSYAASAFILDIKGENYAITSGWRRRSGNLVLRYDPAQQEGSCAWNPIGEIRFGTRYQISDTQNIALMVVDSDGAGLKGNHFRSAAFELLVGIILHALYKSKAVGREPCLQDCAHMLTSAGDFATPEEEKEFDDGDSKGLSALFQEMQNVALDDLGEAAREAQIVIRGVGYRMENTPSRELGSIISTANTELALYRDPIVGENTSRSDFKIADLMDHDKPVSLYFVTNPRDLVRMRPLARLLLTQIVAGLTDSMQFSEGRSITKHKHDLLLMLDEFPSLGKLEMFESALAFIRGYGIKAYIITQDVQQLYKAYTNYESIISNCDVRVAYAPNKLETAEWLSRMTGQTTVIKEQISTSGKRFGGGSDSYSRSYQETQRPLLTANETTQLKKLHTNSESTEPGEMLVFKAGSPVVFARQTPYFLDETFNARSKIPPPAKSDIVRHKEEVAK